LGLWLYEEPSEGFDDNFKINEIEVAKQNIFSIKMNKTKNTRALDGVFL